LGGNEHFRAERVQRAAARESRTGLVTDEQRIRDLVRRVVYRTVGRAEPPAQSASPAPRLVTERDVQEAPAGGTLRVAAGALITPLARQAALERRVRLDVAAASSTVCDEVPAAAAAERTVAIGADHAGVALKAELAGLLGSLGYRVVDCGTGSSDPVD